MPKSSLAFKIWFVVAGGLVLLVGAGFLFAQTNGPTNHPTFYPTNGPINSPANGPTFYPSHRQPSGPAIPPTFPPAISSPSPSSWQPAPYGPSPYDLSPSPYSVLPTITSLDDPTALLPYFITSANQNGLLPTACILGIMFIFQYVRSSQKTACQREQFMQSQLDQSSRRTDHELSQSSMKLSELDMGLRTMQEQFRQQAELIHTSGQVCRDIVNVMASHNEAVLQGMNEIFTKVNGIDAKIDNLKRKR